MQWQSVEGMEFKTHHASLDVVSGRTIHVLSYYAPTYSTSRQVKDVLQFPSEGIGLHTIS